MGVELPRGGLFNLRPPFIRLEPEVCDDAKRALSVALLPAAGDEAFVSADVFHKAVNDDLHRCAGSILDLGFEVKFPGCVRIGNASRRGRQFDVLHGRRISSRIENPAQGPALGISSVLAFPFELQEDAMLGGGVLPPFTTPAAFEWVSELCQCRYGDCETCQNGHKTQALSFHLTPPRIERLPTEPRFYPKMVQPTYSFWATRPC